MTESPELPSSDMPQIIAGRYQVVARVGSGGMGVVYKALDTRLNRFVAIKAIHSRRLADGASSDRLRAEAQTAASLDHPYICKIYEFIDTAGESFLVMEFVEGDTLSSILQRGVPPVARTIRLACEIAEGLAAAHDRGLVHRDVKPANVMVTAHDHVKLLDFGLARPDVEISPSAHTRTSPSDHSDYAGTPQYMAPEQARGEAVTARADLFSFGVVLFECLTGKLPFAGNSGYDYVRHLLSDDPRSLEKLAPHAPIELVRLIEKCLEKTPADRPDSAANIVETLNQLSQTMSAQDTRVRTAGDERSSRRWRIALVAAAITVVAIGGWRWYSAPKPDDTLRQSRPFLTWPGDESESRISPDGRWLSFIATRTGEPQLYVQPLDGSEAKLVAMTAGLPQSQTWSPDGRELACVIVQDDRAIIQIVPAFFGGTVRRSITLDHLPTQVRVLRWIGRALYLQIDDDGGRALARVDLDSGVMTRVSASWSLPGTLRGVDVSADGRQVVVSVASGGQDDLWTAALDGSSLTRLTNDAFFERAPIWSGAGTIVYQSNRGGQVDLWELAPDTRRTWPLTSSQTEETPDSTSADGTIISFAQDSESARLWLWDDNGRARPLTADAVSDFSPAIAADGRTLAFQRSQPSPSQGHLLLDSKLLSASIGDDGFTSDPHPIGDGFAAVLSPDATWMAFLQRSAQSARTTLQVKNIATGTTTVVSTTCPLPVLSSFPADWAEHLIAWSPKGDDLYFVDQDAGRSIRHYLAGAAKADPPLVTVGAQENLRDLFPSPDGRHLGYLTWSNHLYTFRVMDLMSGATRDVAHLAGSPTSVYGRGWFGRGRTDNASFVLVRSLDTARDRTADVEVLVVDGDDKLRRAALISHAFIATSRLDSDRGALELTRSEHGIHNLFEVALSTGAMRQRTDNALPGVTYSGIVPLGRGRLVAVADERNRDVWLIESHPNGGAGRGLPPR